MYIIFSFSLCSSITCCSFIIFCSLLSNSAAILSPLSPPSSCWNTKWCIFRQFQFNNFQIMNVIFSPQFLIKNLKSYLCLHDFDEVLLLHAKVQLWWLVILSIFLFLYPMVHALKKKIFIKYYYVFTNFKSTLRWYKPLVGTNSRHRLRSMSTRRSERSRKEFNCSCNSLMQPSNSETLSSAALLFFSLKYTYSISN